MSAILMICGIISASLLAVEYHRYAVSRRQLAMYNVSESPLGVYFPSGYYCVWVQGKSLEEIEDTDAHERCHAFIAKDWQHFCGDKP